jgi:acyl-CoA synthetase (NDP forming)
MLNKRLLQPSSIAVYGGASAQELIRQCDGMGFMGQIWPVHPGRTEILGRKVYPSTRALPAAPDAAYIAVNRHATIDIVRDLAAMGAGGAVCFATGFTEAGEDGAALQAQLLEASGDMSMIGPNCYGMLNYIEGAMLWPDQQGGRRVEEGVAIITMSSNVGFNLTMQRRGLPIAYMVSLGNRLKFDIDDAIRTFASQDRVTAIGLYLESVGDPARFERAVADASALGKPIVAIKTGRSEISKKIVVSHTSSLAGSDELIDALFERTGVGRVNSLEALIEALKVLHVLGPLEGGRMGVMSTSGGDLSLVGDAMSGSGLSMPAMDEDVVDKVRNTVHERIVVANPLDYQMFDWNNEARLTKMFTAFMQQDFDISINLLDYPRADRCDPSGWYGSQQGFINAAGETRKASAIMATFTDTLPEPLAEQLIRQGVVPLAGIEAGLAGIQAAVDIGAALKREPHVALLSNFDPPSGRLARIKDEAESKKILATYGVPVPASRIVSHTDEAIAAARELGFPVALKALGVAHKTDVGGVALNLNDIEAVEQALLQMSHLSNRFLIETMVDGIIAELIVGVARDEQFGPYIVIGNGGVLVEIMKDSKSLLLPITHDQVLDALNSLNCAALFHGFRGKPRCDLEAAVKAILAISSLVKDHSSTIAEVDINPLMLLASGQGVVAADALISFYENE